MVKEYMKYLAVYLEYCFVRAGRIELPTPPWQGGILPLNHARIDIDTVSHKINISISNLFLILLIKTLPQVIPIFPDL